MEELGPMVDPWQAHLTVFLMLLFLRPCVINLLTRFICNRINTIKLQLVKQYQRLPLDDSPKMPQEVMKSKRREW
jgi:hypothetical protein